jgi:RecB family exonuclease
VADFEPRQEVSVSALTAILHCSSQYLFRYELGMEPLPEIERGLPPLERGRRIHDVLMACGRRIPSRIERPETTVDALFEELREIALEELEEDLEDFHWSVEINRLLGGEGDIPGLLQEWLRREWERFQDGWKWVAFERAFNGLKLGEAAISVKGRLDRLDYHAEYGYVCWDYKTGSPPAPKEVLVDLTHPQLPAYLLAVRKGLIREAESDGAGLGAGYIDLRSVRYFKHSQHIKSSIDLGAFLNQWEEVLAKALKELEEGSLTPRWMREDSCDSNCPYGCLCGKLMREILKTD